MTASIISIAAGRIPAAITPETAAPASSVCAEAGEQRAHRLGRAQDPQRQLRRDPERPLGADERAEQAGPVVPHGELDELAVRQHDLRCEHVVDGEAVLEAVRAAGVLGDVASDRADLLRGRIRRVVEAVGRDRARDVEVRDAGLDDDLPALDVDLEDARQARERDDDPFGHRQRAAGETGAGAAGDERDPLLVAQPDDRLHLRGAARERDESRDDAVTGQAVALVRPQLLRLADRLRDRGEPVEQRGSHPKRPRMNAAPSRASCSGLSNMRRQIFVAPASSGSESPNASTTSQPS